jgi:hypothetical protein
MRRPLGFAIMFVLLLPFDNVGLPTLAIPFSSGMTAYAAAHGDSCADSIGIPPLLGFDGSCAGFAADEPVLLTTEPAESESRALEQAYERVGYRAGIVGPSYGAGEDYRAGKALAVSHHPTPVVKSFSLTGGTLVVERPTGSRLVLGLITAALFLTGAGMLFWPRRRSSAAQGVGGGEASRAQRRVDAGEHAYPD